MNRLRVFAFSTVSMGALLAAAPAVAQQAAPTDPTQTTGPATGTVEEDPTESTTNNTIAQQSSQTATGEVPEEQAIVVTGSRIARPEIEAPVPLTVVGQEALLQDAAQNIADVINELPQAAIGTTRTNTNFLTSGTGVSAIDLRNLGTSRTLTLVNGRRFIGGFAGDSAVDVNNIPTDFVDRIEIVTGGSSAVYGSDAIAGVVNFILKEKFDGLQARLQAGITDEGDNPTYLFSLTGGQSLMDGRLNLIGNFTLDEDEGLYSRNRAISDQDCGLGYVTNPNTGLVEICGQTGYSTFANQGRFQIYNVLGSAANIVDGQSLFTFNPDNSFVSGFPTGYGFNRNNERLISTPISRRLLTGLANFEITPDVKFFVEGSHSWVNADASLEPLAISPATTGTDYIAPDNAFIPANIAALINTANTNANPNDDILLIDYRRRLNDVFDRSNHARRKVLRIATGFKGQIAEKYGFEVSYVFGRMNDFNSSEEIQLDQFNNALDAVNSGGNIVCRINIDADPTNNDPNCVPINIFGVGTVSPEAAAYVAADIPKTRDILNKQHVLSGSISGPVFSLWAGEVRAAVGAEYREESTREELDELTNTGGNSGNVTPDLAGKFNVKEIFGEVSIPLIADASFTRYFGLTGAARYSDYSTVGGIFSYNVGAEWEPVRDVRFRAMRAVANRAPNIGELFTQPSETFAAISDPCNGTTATSTAAIADLCRAIPGIAAAIAADGTFDYTLADQQAINGFTGGSPDLSEEQAKTTTIGVVFTPTAIPGFSATVDYYDIKLKDAIATLGRQNSVNQCILTGNPAFCSNVIRNPANGFITRVDAQLQNVAGARRTGVDLGVQYSRRLNLFADDRFAASLNYTYLINSLTQANPTVPESEAAGTFGRGFSTQTAIARASYQVSRVKFSWETQFLEGAGFFGNGIQFGVPELDALNELPDYWLHAAQVRFDPNERFSFFLNVDNIFDTKPRLLPGAVFGTPTGLETSADYDVFGRRFVAGVRVKLL